MLYVNPLTASRTPSAGAADSPQRRKQALQEFEHLLAFQLLREMRKTVPKNELFGASMESDFYQEIMDDFVSGQMAASGQLGVAKLMEQQLSRGEPARPDDPKNAPLALDVQTHPLGSRMPAFMPINTPVAAGTPLPRMES